MSCSRRKFLKSTLTGTIAASLPVSAFRLLSPAESKAATTGKENTRWGFLVDTTKCVGCGMCVHACPFGAVGFDKDRGRPFKCDLCGGDPLCVRFCEPGALTFKDASMLQYAQARAAALRVAGGRR